MAVIGFSLFFTLIAVGLLGYSVAFWLFVAMFLVLVVAVIIMGRRLPTKFMAITVSVMIACAMFCTYTKLIYNRVVRYAGSELSLTFEMDDYEGESNGTHYYQARIVNSEHKALEGAKIRLSSSSRLDAQVDDFISASVSLDVAGSELKTSRLYYKSSGIFLKAHIFDEYTIEKNPDRSLGFYFFEIKQAITEIVTANLNEESAAVVRGIFLGDTSGLNGIDNTNFRNIGISHIFCVSGLHVSLISATVYKFLSAMIERKRILYTATLFAIWFFVAITGFSYSSIRSGVMLSIYYVGRMIGREGNSLNSLGTAAVVLCILNPFSATNISLLYSFFATLGMLVMPRPDLKKIKGRFLRSVAEVAVMSVNVAAFTLPIQIFFFGTATVISPIANCFIFFAIPPLMSCVIIAVILSLFTSILSSFFFAVCAVITKYLLLISDLLSEIPFSTIDTSMSFVGHLVAVIVVMLLAIAYLGLGRKVKRIASIACVTLFFGSIVCYNIFLSPVMTVTVIDSGGATSVVVTQGIRSIVIGCGGGNYTASEISYVLQQKAMNSVDLLVLPGKDSTEAVNIDGLTEGIDVKTVISGEEYGLLYSLNIGSFVISCEGEYTVGRTIIRYRYTDECKITYIENGESSVLVVSRLSDEYELDDEWQNADAVISVNRYFSTDKEKISVLCVDENGDYPVSEVCYKNGGNIVIDFYKNGTVNCERRA